MGYPFKYLGNTNWKCFNKTSVFKTAVLLTSVLRILPGSSNFPIETNPSKKLLPINTENVIKRILEWRQSKSLFQILQTLQLILDLEKISELSCPKSLNWSLILIPAILIQDVKYKKKGRGGASREINVGNFDNYIFFHRDS